MKIFKIIFLGEKIIFFGRIFFIFKISISTFSYGATCLVVLTCPPSRQTFMSEIKESANTPDFYKVVFILYSSDRFLNLSHFGRFGDRVFFLVGSPPSHVKCGIHTNDRKFQKVSGLAIPVISGHL